MTLLEKRQWLSIHGRIVKRSNYSGFDIWSVLWKSKGGVYFRGEGKTKDLARDRLFTVVKENLYQHIVNP